MFTRMHDDNFKHSHNIIMIGIMTTCNSSNGYARIMTQHARTVITRRYYISLLLLLCTSEEDIYTYRCHRLYLSGRDTYFIRTRVPSDLRNRPPRGYYASTHGFRYRYLLSRSIM